MIPLKVIAIGVVATALVVGIRGAYQTAWQSGYDAAQLEMSREVQARISKAVERARAQWENLTELADEQIVTETEIVEVERIVERKIPVVVEKVVERTPDCSDLGVEFVGLLNEQVAASLDANIIELPANTAEPNAGM